MSGVVIFDLDGCISDDRWRREYIDNLRTGAPHWEDYHDRAQMDHPVNEPIVDRHLRTADRIMFSTARPDRYRVRTENWLRRHFVDPGEERVILAMRPEGDLSPSATMKIAALYAHGITPDEVTAAYDDREDVIAAYREWGIRNTIKLTAHSPDHPSSAPERGVPEVLRGMADTFSQRHTTYGDSYLTFGEVAAALWPRGLAVSSVAEFNRLGVLTQIIGKLVRYTGAGQHKDSAHDMAVYAAILESLTDEEAGE